MMLYFAKDYNIMFNTFVFPWIVTTLIIGGVVVACWRERTYLPFCLFLGVYALPFFYVNAGATDLYRYQSGFLYLAILLLALVVTTIEKTRTFASYPVLGYTLLFLLVGLLSVPAIVRANRYDDRSREYCFLKESIPQLPRKGTLVLPAGENFDHRSTRTVFPVYLLRQYGKNFNIFTIDDFLKNSPQQRIQEQDVFFYRPLACYWFRHNDTKLGESSKAVAQESCTRLGSRFHLEPFAVTSYSHYRPPGWPERPHYYFFDVRAREITIGFYRVETQAGHLEIN
jgi:hypothetical protein